MPKFRKKAVVIDAIQFTGDNADAVRHFIGDSYKTGVSTNADGKSDGIVIHTLEGDLLASVNDWIIKGTKGEFYPCKPDIFQEIYESAE